MDDLHALIEDVWIARHDDELQAERAQRRKGRPPSIREGQLELIKNTELEEYRTGIGAPPLPQPPPRITHPLQRFLILHIAQMSLCSAGGMRKTQHSSIF